MEMRRTVHPQRVEVASVADPEAVFAVLSDLRQLPRWWSRRYDDPLVREGERVVRPVAGGGLVAGEGVVVEVEEADSYALLRGKERLVESAAVTRLTCTVVVPNRRLRLEHQYVLPKRDLGPVYTDVELTETGGGSVIALERGYAVSGVGLRAAARRCVLRHTRATLTTRRMLSQLDDAARNGLDCPRSEGGSADELRDGR